MREVVLLCRGVDAPRIWDIVADTVGNLRATGYISLYNLRGWNLKQRNRIWMLTLVVLFKGDISAFMQLRLQNPKRRGGHVQHFLGNFIWALMSLFHFSPLSPSCWLGPWMENWDCLSRAVGPSSLVMPAPPYTESIMAAALQLAAAETIWVSFKRHGVSFCLIWHP